MTDQGHPVRLVEGMDALSRLPDLARELGISRPLVVTDPVILASPAGRRLTDLLTAAGMAYRVFDGCGIDARVSHIEAEAARLSEHGHDGVIGLGGGSALCTAKGIAIRATNGPDIRALETAGVGTAPLPMILVPTTAGSGTEVSPFTIIRDDVHGGKFTIGGPKAYAAAAVLDPLTLESLPPRLAAIAAVDALTHAVEAYLSHKATEESDALALDAAGMLAANLHGSIIEGDPEARRLNLLGAARANMACGIARLGLAHRLSRPLEEAFGLPHGVAVGVLLPRVLPVAAAALPGRADRLAQAMGIEGGAASLPRALMRHYAEIGFPITFDPEQVPASRLRDCAEAAAVRASDEDAPERVEDATPIRAANGQTITVAEAARLYAACRG